MTTQTKSNPTQGEWKMLLAPLQIVTDEIVIVHATSLYAPSSERYANARLIAAAPDLLEALKDVSKAYQDMFDVMPVAFQTYMHTVDQAIKKAEGES